MTGRRFSLATTEDNGFTGRDRERFGELFVFSSVLSARKTEENGIK